MLDLGLHFDDRESFEVAESVLEVVRRGRSELGDNDAVWEAFIDWRGGDQREYLQRIRLGGKYVFYSVLQDLYRFAEEMCRRNVARDVGRELAARLLERHLPDLLQSTVGRKQALSDQIMWLLERFLCGASGDIYALETEDAGPGNGLAVEMRYRNEAEMVDYLRRSGHNPERAFADSLNVFHGATELLLERIVEGFTPEQFNTELRELRGRCLVELKQSNQFHSENIIALLLDHVHRLREEPESVESDSGLHVSAAMQSAWRTISKAAACEEIVLLCGESGTGKSYHARRIHESSARRDGPFIEVGLTSDLGSDNFIQSNLFGHVRGAFTGSEGEKQGLFSLADGGTIFLDEIGDASPDLQGKLLRVIESKSFRMLNGVEEVSVDVRIIVATNRNLPAMVASGAFRKDLYFRLNVIEITLPPLRERAEDMPALATRLFENICRDANKLDKQLTDDALRSLCACDWPGNIRELDNALRRAVAFCDKAEITSDDLFADSRRPAPAVSSGGRIIDRDVLRDAIASAPESPEEPSHEWAGHVDYVRREYLRALIDYYNGDLAKLAKHWDRSSENTLLKLVRQFDLTDELRAARKRKD
ncbi:MAG: sigma 54-interacting transcriptional regulator [Phycisphaerae bacterium]|jgi:DNA-binding NtrC family response regulator|nr:sigma 54-interacting transcriptional regulator [Phycisphaerae bacterium]